MKNSVKSFAVSLCLLCLAGGSALAADDARDRRAGIEQLIDITGGLAIGQQMVQTMTAEMAKEIKAKRPDFPQKLLDALSEEINAVVAENMPVMKEFSISQYERNFTQDEIRELLNFYSSDIGKKIIRTLPAMMQQSLSFGMQWGQSLRPEMIRRVRARLQKESFEL